MESGKKTLQELTTAGVFHVPDYQRYYSWTKAEWDDLWTDLSTLPPGKDHYFGTIIIQKTTRTASSGPTDGFGNDADRPINLLIDGQQRLTSLTLLVHAMTEALDEIAPATDHEADIREAVAAMREAFIVDENIYQVKLLDEHDDEYLQRIVEDRNLPAPDRPSQRKMHDAKAYFDNRLAELRDDPDNTPLEAANEIQSLWQTIQGLELMVYVVDADKPEKATLIFDSVNDRGRSLSTFDKTKSFLMRMAYLAAPTETEAQTVISEIRQAFGEMYTQHQRIVDSPHGDDLSDDDVQRYHFISFFDWSKREDHQTPAFLHNFKSKIRSLRTDDPQDCLEYIREYTTSLERGFTNLANVLDYRNDDELAQLIDRIHRLRHATKFYPMLLSAWPSLDHDERVALLDAIETYVFRVYAIGNHPNYTGRSSIQTLTRDTAPDSSIDVWERGLVDIMHYYEDDAQFERTLTSSDFYSKVVSQDLRYLFYFYNEYRAREEGESGSISLAEAMGKQYTIEHIWPQTPEEIPITDPGEYDSVKERYEASKHRLGNLTLASGSWNSTWGNDNFQTKREEGYQASKLWAQWELQSYDEWSLENLEAREATLVEFVLEKWATPETRLTDVEEPQDAVSELTHQERVVLAALRQHSSGAARRVVHRTASTIDESPFENPNSSGEERDTVGSILSRLASVGLADREKSTWYPSDEALAVEDPI